MRRDETGVAVVLSVALVGMLATAGLLAAAIGAVVVNHREAQAAADLAALAGATAAQAGRGPCDEARRIAAANGVALAGCETDGGGMVEVVVSRPLAPSLTRRDVRARARAGPVGVLPGLPPSSRVARLR